MNMMRYWPPVFELLDSELLQPQSEFLGDFRGFWGISGEALFAAQALAKSCVRGDMHLLMRWLHSFGGVIELLWLQHLLCVRTASRRYELFNRQTQ